MKILLTGGSSMIGRAIAENLQDYKVLAPTHRELDLMYKDAIEWVDRTERPDIVIHCAGFNGGIAFNRKYPADIYHNTLYMGLNVLKACRRAKKIVFLLPSCAYPPHTSEPERLWEGKPHESVECHGLAKRAIVDYGRMLHKQYGVEFVPICLNNCFGPHSKFDAENSKVVEAFITKFYEAKKANQPTVTCWGTGQTRRSFLYSKDAGRMITELALHHVNCGVPYNISPSSEITIKQLAEKVKNIMGYEGNIYWDLSKPDGQDAKPMQSYFKLGFTPFEDALRETIEWYINERRSNS